jgi:hypothetical protein
VETARGLRVANSRVVHLAGTAPDHRGDELPAPACHVGIAGWDPRRLNSTTSPVTCVRCVRLIEARQLARPIEQLAVF